MGGSIKTLFVLSVIAATMFAITENYTKWITDEAISSEDFTCREKFRQLSFGEVLFGTGQNGSISEGLECTPNIPIWFNLIWIAPLGAALIYAVAPFVK